MAQASTKMASLDAVSQTCLKAVHKLDQFWDTVVYFWLSEK